MTILQTKFQRLYEKLANSDIIKSAEAEVDADFTEEHSQCVLRRVEVKSQLQTITKKHAPKFQKLQAEYDAALKALHVLGLKANAEKQAWTNAKRQAESELQKIEHRLTTEFGGELLDKFERKIDGELQRLSRYQTRSETEERFVSRDGNYQLFVIKSERPSVQRRAEAAATARREAKEILLTIAGDDKIQQELDAIWDALPAIKLEKIQ